MNKILLTPKEIPLYGSYDVVVVGGGTAGAIAAASALEANLSVLVIEQNGQLGGMQTTGLVTTIMGTCFNEPLYRVYEESLLSREWTEKLKSTNDLDCYALASFNPESMAVALDELVTSRGGEILFHTTHVDVVRQENRIQYAVFSNKNGLQAVEGKYFIDCTGDADLCVLAGVPWYSGNAEGLNQNVSLRFEMAQVDIPVYEKFMEDIQAAPGGRDAFMKQKYNEGYLREEDIDHFQTFTIPGKPNCLSFNCPELGRAVNVVDSRYSSRMMIEGRKAVMKLARFVRECVPGFENAFVTKIATSLGIRDSRRIQAEYMLTSNDVFAYRKFPDGIAPTAYPLDAHGEKNYAMDIGHYREDVPYLQRYYEVPFRSLIPVGIDNLLCAGRCAGTDFYAQSTTRIQHTCQFMGEAAGIACRLAGEEGKPFRELDGSKVREEMVKRGHYLLKQTKDEKI